mmetsp:Transcript_56689/g.143585  ORF Transcript_56689/g.143585 Transcript_56689/m.143585 type:complete len:243 (+) Transcript_56689:1054-1782(+)
MHQVVLVAAKQQLYGVISVAAALCAAAAQQYIPGDDCRLDLRAIVLGTTRPLQDSRADVGSQLVAGRVDELDAVNDHTVALQVFSGLVQAWDAAPADDPLQDPLDGDDHRFVVDDRGCALVLRARGRDAQALVELLDAAVAMRKLRRLLHQKYPLLTLLLGFHLKNVAKVRASRALQVHWPVQSEGREPPESLPLTANAADARCQIHFLRSRELAALLVDKQTQGLSTQHAINPAPSPPYPT